MDITKFKTGDLIVLNCKGNCTVLGEIEKIENEIIFLSKDTVLYDIYTEWTKSTSTEKIPVSDILVIDHIKNIPVYSKIYHRYTWI